MKFTIDKIVIRDVLSRIQGITGKKTNLAITETVLIKTDESGIHLMATDSENGMEGFYPAEVEEEGSIAINAKKLFEIVKDFPSDKIVVHEVERRFIEIIDESTEYRIVGLNPDDFPEMPDIGEIELFEMPSADFKHMVENTVFVVGPVDDSRAHIHGCFFERFEMDDGIVLRMISTDSNRLSKVDYVYPKDAPIPIEPGILIPKKGLSEVIKFLDDEGVVRIGFMDNQLVVKKENETVIIRLLEGKLPPYDAIIERGDDFHSIEMDKKMFMAMLRRMSILTTEDYKAVLFAFGNDKLTITTTNPELGESKEEMNIDYEGDPLQMAFNPRFFIDALNMIADDTVYTFIVHHKRPCFIEGMDDRNLLSVIMPMSI